MAVQSVLMTDCLRFKDRFIIGLGRGTYQWISVKRFLVKRGCTETEILSSLVGNIEYRDVYLGPNDDHALQLHGPYNVDLISESSFSVCLPQDAVVLVRSYSSKYFAPDETVADVRSRIIVPIERSAIVWKLADLGDDVRDEAIGSILRDFEELVIYDKAVAELLLVVMAGD